MWRPSASCSTSSGSSNTPVLPGKVECYMDRPETPPVKPTPEMSSGFHLCRATSLRMAGVCWSVCRPNFLSVCSVCMLVWLSVRPSVCWYFLSIECVFGRQSDLVCPFKPVHACPRVCRASVQACPPVCPSLRQSFCLCLPRVRVSALICRCLAGLFILVSVFDPCDLLVYSPSRSVYRASFYLLSRRLFPEQWVCGGVICG